MAPGFIDIVGQSVLCLAEGEKLETPDVHTADFSYMRKRKQEYSAKVRKALKRKALNLGQKREVTRKSCCKRSILDADEPA